jgi:GTPase SAR1 family protein
MTETAGAAEGGNSGANMHMKYKIVFLGDQNVGKTSIILRFTQDTFDGNYQVRMTPFPDPVNESLKHLSNNLMCVCIGNDWYRLFVEDHVC